MAETDRSDTGKHNWEKIWLMMKEEKGIAVYTRSRRRRVLEPDNIPLKTQSFLLKWPFFLVEPLRKR
ncbi:hypothetical protein D0Y65_016956 [Glycine soja]|uniref:Uncharacterized protein n=1 Tax=Glycine soja TaxID=3848 RepID=A0A445JSM6_GLYSO|nr:hypothetical protein D0Y65_016956 [Glycine soja]